MGSGIDSSSSNGSSDTLSIGRVEWGTNFAWGQIDNVRILKALHTIQTNSHQPIFHTFVKCQKK